MAAFDWGVSSSTSRMFSTDVAICCRPTLALALLTVAVIKQSFYSTQGTPRLPSPRASFTDVLAGLGIDGGFTFDAQSDRFRTPHRHANRILFHRYLQLRVPPLQGKPQPGPIGQQTWGEAYAVGVAPETRKSEYDGL